MFSVAAAIFACLVTMWAINPALAVESQPKVEGWDVISITQEAKVSTGKRAILIANSAYKYLNPLPAPPHDVEAIASQLSQLGFETTILRNPTSDQIIQAIATASPRGGRGSLLTFYYSGHAAEIDGENSLLLTGYRLAEGRNGDQIVPLRLILMQLATANFEKVFIAFDACRNMITTADAKPTQADAENAILPNGFHGLARADSDFQTLNHKEYAVLFSTSHGDTAIDSTVDGLSPFTKAFLLALGKETSFMPAMLLTKRITEEITNRVQSPDIQIKWNTDLTYARSSAVTNSAVYDLNSQITAAEMAASTIDLSKITTIRPELDTQYPGVVLNLRDDEFKICQEDRNKPFFWYSDVLIIDSCYLTQLGYKRADKGESAFYDTPGAAVYNSTKYMAATWSFDLDFDGSPETIRASLRNADMALNVTSKTSEFEFRGLIGPNITFIGLHDFNKDGVLDVYIVYSVSDSSRPELTTSAGQELIILDGRKIAKELKTIKQCDYSEKASSDAICRRLSKIRSRMTGSLFMHDIDMGYYGADILQIALYADWYIKDWSIDENGTLHLTTYSATWPYERNQGGNEKLVAYDPVTGKLNISLSGEKQRSLSIAPLESQIVVGTDFNDTTADANPQPTWCPNAKTVIETLICSTPQLAAADIKMSNLLAVTVKRKGSNGDFQRRRNAWLSKRNACAFLETQSSRMDCVSRSYDQWIAELQETP
jgi:hypothetical protein